MNHLFYTLSPFWLKNQIKQPPKEAPNSPSPVLPQVKCSVSCNPNRMEIYSACVWYSRAHVSPLRVWNLVIWGNTYTNCGNGACPHRPAPTQLSFGQEVFWQFLKGSLSYKCYRANGFPIALTGGTDSSHKRKGHRSQVSRLLTQRIVTNSQTLL